MLMYINYMPGEARPTEEPLSGGKKMKQSSNAKIASTPRKRGEKSSATAAILPRRPLLS